MKEITLFWQLKSCFTDMITKISFNTFLWSIGRTQTQYWREIYKQEKHQIKKEAKAAKKRSRFDKKLNDCFCVNEKTCRANCPVNRNEDL